MQPKYYTVDEHTLPPEKVDRHAFYVIQKLRQKGFSAYLVGGGVRDLLLGVKPKDFDISTSAKPEDVKAIFSNSILIGKRFRLAHVRFGRKILEVSTFRAGDPETSTLIVRDNDYGTEEEDVLRRDFTINGLYYDPELQQVIDYVGGYQDIQKKILRTIGQAEIRFRQDPVRMIRLLKFHARFGFEIDQESLKALKICKEDITKSSQARIFEELLRMLESGSSKPFFQNLSKHGLLELLMPNLDKWMDKDKVFSYLDHIDQQEDRTDFARPLLWSCLLFPILQQRVESAADEKPLHLGLIAQKANQLIDQIFYPFFHIPRKMRGTMIFILTSQYRFVPLHRKFSRVRVPKDPSFAHAMKFFEIRCALYPELMPHYERWEKVTIPSEAPTRPPRKRRRKRPRESDNPS